MPKRKASGDAAAPVVRRSARRAAVPVPEAVVEPAVAAQSQAKRVKTSAKMTVPETMAATVTADRKRKSGARNAATIDDNPKSSSPVPKDASTTKAEPAAEDEPAGEQFWLMKAEPESRIENGHDVRFSIDDLAARTKPEPWDGIRAYAARNNLRAMKKGELAFFYHSNCKEPGIVGIMEIVSEHEPDVTAYDPAAAYYDPKDSAENPKWSIVKVVFRRKFKHPITLKELKEFGAGSGALANMQMLRQSRLSVSRVSAQEWKFVMGVAEERDARED